MQIYGFISTVAIIKKIGKGKMQMNEEKVLSVVIPVYNEINTIERVIDKVRGCGIKTEIIIVDDYSTDGTRELLKEKLNGKVDKVLYHKKNRGKGVALRHGFAAATGDYVVVQDADLEYDPRDFMHMMKPFISGECDADVVYGSRYLRSNNFRVDGFYHELGNKMLTTLSNICSNLSLSDMETCYKMFRREIIQNINLEEDRFGFEPEITAKLAKKKCRIYEVPINYHPRTFEEGKKIGIKDAFRAFYCIIKYNFLARD